MNKYNCPKCGNERWTSDYKSRICIGCGNRYVPQINQSELFTNTKQSEVKQ